MTHGWMGKILDVNLTTGTISTRDTMPYAPSYIGGRALASRIAWEEIPASADALDPENRVIIATGPLCGTLAPTSGRTIMSSLSPRTYPRAWYTYSTVGGWFGPELKYAGFDAIVITGKAESPVYLEIHDEEVRLADAADLWGLDARETQLTLKSKLGEQTKVLTIGPAGENLVRFATVQHEEENAAAHMGFGAVWGSKYLKAVTVRGTKGVSVAYPEELIKEMIGAGIARRAPTVAFLKEKSAQSSKKPRPVCTQACAFNCSIGGYESTPEGRLIPAFCIGRVWRLDAMAPATYYSGGGVRVPPSRSFGRSEEIFLHELCNSLGIDLWFRLVMQPWFIRCRELGINKIREYDLEPENGTWFKQFMYQLANREGLGDIFAEDLRRAMDELEGELPEELIWLGRELEFNFGFPAHREGRFWDGEPLPFWVISAMMLISSNRDPSIGTHQSCLLNAEFFLADKELSRRQFRRLSEKVWGYADAFEPTFENKAPLAIWTQDQHMLIDSLPLCDFAFPQLVRPFENRAEWEASEDISGDIDLTRRLLVDVTGQEISWEDMTLATRRAFTIERVLAARAGKNRVMEETLASHFTLPCASDGTFISEEDFSRLIMDAYYSARGWDLEKGLPLPETLRALGLEELIPELDEIRRSAL